MDYLLTLMLEIILEGTFSATVNKKVPFVVRIILVALLISLWLGLCVLLFKAGIGTGRYALVVLSAVIFVVYIVIIAGKIKKLKG
ncbi:MAG: hypothetical protein E7483_06225 [Ruminococcaceae bacterium]|nr:hypothetical protein [Oscillospiraceae bacterium]